MCFFHLNKINEQQVLNLGELVNSFDVTERMHDVEKQYIGIHDSEHDDNIDTSSDLDLEYLQSLPTEDDYVGNRF